ncbi:MAG: PaaI family thioesterase [Gammaproteobacteria bacterium AqS3]|nr:PaaI family thioesterase [Gammaproteobacteria bacterium AqS3]
MTEEEFTRTVMQQIPYAETMGLEIARFEPDALICRLPFDADHIGNTQLPALHGGALASAMEVAVTLEAVRRQLSFLKEAGDAPVEVDWAALAAQLPVPVNVTVQYLRSARDADVHLRAEVLKSGRRSSTVFCRLWQDDAGKPVASMTGVLVRSA